MGQATIDAMRATVEMMGRCVGVGLETKVRLSLKEVRAMGRLLIKRERAEAAKGGE